ncbi:alpha/beta hydrolase [Cryobacterium adonitolivorans]|uniref:Alpha/beta hydrolase n=1 Tax=Cryobacterium adonitolivorans TaxID=1259189 RepID=A0A4V3ID01_9MICO|nr:alpha/beta hydrolase [Cryobacterium adonitolivorans]TFC04089.1 alpha/beta hydrolase [Cryobacterium adonitolivorans]
MSHLEAADRADSFVSHSIEEHVVDLGEIRMNYATLGDPSLPALVLIPSQSESWWGYERAMPLLAEHFQVFAIDLRGQGRSTWTPGRYTVDTMAGDVVRFIDLVIGRPTIVSGMSSGGVIAAWLSAYAKPGQILGAVYEDTPLFASELVTSCGQPVNQGMGPSQTIWNKYLGDQWSVGNWEGLKAAFAGEISRPLRDALAVMFPPVEGETSHDGRPPQNLKEYDPEWGRSFSSGLATAGCDHATMLSHVKVPVLFTHHYHQQDAETGIYQGAISDPQATRVRELVTAAGQACTYLNFPGMPHSMHGHQPALYTRTVSEWAAGLLQAR